MDVLPTEYQEHEALIEVAKCSTTVHNVGVAPTDYIEHIKLVLKYVARQSSTVYKASMVPTEYPSHEAFIEVVR